MNVRSRLSLATGLMSVSLLLAIYGGGWLILKALQPNGRFQIAVADIPFWLALLVAAAGLFFLLPLFLIQRRLALDPLQQLAAELQLCARDSDLRRRMGWRRQDEFGIVAATVDGMLDMLVRVHGETVESERRLRALLTANPDLIFVFDRQGTILDAGLRAADPALPVNGHGVGRRLESVEGVHPEIAAGLTQRVAAAIDSGQPQVFEYSITKPSGARYWAEARMVCMAPDRALAIVRDITAERNAQLERHNLEEKMVQAQKLESLGLLAGGIAHDFNNILTAILGHAEEAQRLLPPGAPASGAVQNIQRSATHASMLIRQMLAYAGRGYFEFRPTQINGLLGEMIELLRTSLSKQAQFELDLRADLPMVEADASQLWQVAMNLLVNASDALAGRPGQIRLHTDRLQAAAEELATYISVGTMAPGDYVLMEVSDTGHGMDAATLGRIFDPFFTTKASGRGLGLSAVLGIIRAHRGGIRVTSVPGQGTSFRVLLPVSAAGKAPEAPPAPSPDVLHAPSVQRDLIVLAEDDPDIRRLVTLVLTSEGHAVEAAANGEEALARFVARQAEVALVLMDVEMPGLSCVETVRAMRARDANVPIAIMSGYRESSTRERFEPLQIGWFLTKPFTRDELLGVVNLARGRGLADAVPEGGRPAEGEAGR